MLVFRLTIEETIARVCGLRLTISKGAEGGRFLCTQTANVTVIDKIGVGGWDSLETKVQRLLEQFASAT